MDYEKKYYKALEDMRAIYPNLNIDARLAVEHAFPEFTKEREDGWYIEELQGFLDSFGEDYFGKGEWQRFADWLEKQKEQKPAERSDALEIDTIRDWSMRFAPDIREEIVATAYHFYNLRSK